MASTQATHIMSSKLPAGYVDLATAMSRGIQESVNVIGFVSDFLPPAPSKGSDHQMKFELKDNSVSQKGLEIKYFRKNLTELPAIAGVGDIILLRHLKIQERFGVFSGLASYKTQHLVFAGNSIVSPAFRASFQVHGSYIPHTKSPGAEDPSIHEQQWVITVQDYFKTTHFPPDSATEGPAAFRPSKFLPTQLPPTHREGNGSTRTANNGTAGIPIHQKPGSSWVASKSVIPAAPRDKLCRLRDLKIENGSKGMFCDLIGEAIKLYLNDQGYTDLYITDYTTNEILKNREDDPRDVSVGKKWPGPLGKRTLLIELLPPHGPWAIQNVKPGDILYLKNVRVKHNNLGDVIGNIWLEENSKQINVSILRHGHPDMLVVQERRKLYFAEQEIDTLRRTGNGLSKKASKKAKKRKRGQDADTSHDAARNQTTNGMNVHSESNKRAKTAKHATEADVPSRYIINTSVKCGSPNMSLSSFEEIVVNPHRWYTSPNGGTFEMAFVNAKHRARLRVVDFYPHISRDFARAVTSKSDANSVVWEWDFWLVLRDGDAHARDTSSINCSVKGRDAQMLIGRDIRPQDLSRASARGILAKLEERLFYLWGELKEKKDKFLHAHPHIKPDEDFSAIQYNIDGDNLPFEACIAEYGIEIPVQEDIRDATYHDRWARVYKICDTVIEE